MTVCLLCAVNVHSMLNYGDGKTLLKETFVASSACQHLMAFLKSLAVSSAVSVTIFNAFNCF